LQVEGFMKNQRVKGIGLLSGGLDSILAVKVLQEQGLELLGVTFTTPFFGAGPGLAAGLQAGIEMRVVDISEIHLAMLKDPRYGYGSQMNPCIDCHGLMLREAGKLLESEQADFLFTGEVLAQRPMSQRRDALRSVEKLSDLEGLILRPLSARLLPPTSVELDGRIDRDRLLDIQGRSRRRQMELARHYGITDYPNASGGCRLTKEGFVNKLRELLSRNPQAGVRDVELLKWGRHFRLPGGSKCIVGRSQSDNQRLQSLADPASVLLQLVDFPGPLGLMPEPTVGEADLQLAGGMVAAYSGAPVLESVTVEWARSGSKGLLTVAKEDHCEFRSHMI
jgi:tRNA-uridine 2-sulfurtransferase